MDFEIEVSPFPSLAFPRALEPEQGSTPEARGNNFCQKVNRHQTRYFMANARVYPTSTA